jgi:hypothetical protein
VIVPTFGHLVSIAVKAHGRISMQHACATLVRPWVNRERCGLSRRIECRLKPAAKPFWKLPEVCRLAEGVVPTFRQDFISRMIRQNAGSIATRSGTTAGRNP